MANLLGSVHTVVNLGKSGAKFNQIVWPQVSDVKPGDVFIVLPFGNELQKQRSRVVNRVWTTELGTRSFFQESIFALRSFFYHGSLSLLRSFWHFQGSLFATSLLKNSWFAP